MISQKYKAGDTMEKFVEGSFRIVQKNLIAADIYDFRILSPDIATLAQPGQFVQIGCDGFFLRRPISICDTDEEQGLIRLVLEVRGEGTRVLAQKECGDSVQIMGPLGRGFTIEADVDKAVFIGGGIGVPPLLMAAKRYGSKAVVSIGFRNADKVILREDFEALGCTVFVCTDDGSCGTEGNSLQGLGSEGNDAGVIYACGPVPMLKGVQAFAKDKKIPCQLSLESRMGCGVGACLVCVCKTKGDSGEHFSHVCKDGPVFDSEKVIL